MNEIVLNLCLCRCLRTRALSRLTRRPRPRPTRTTPTIRTIRTIRTWATGRDSSDPEAEAAEAAAAPEAPEAPSTVSTTRPSFKFCDSVTSLRHLVTSRRPIDISTNNCYKLNHQTRVSNFLPTPHPPGNYNNKIKKNSIFP